MDLSLAARACGALLVVGVVLAGFSALARGNFGPLRFPSSAGNRLVTVVETTQLPNAATLHVVRIGRTYVVLGRSAGCIAKVADVRPEAVEAWLTSRSRKDGPLGSA